MVAHQLSEDGVVGREGVGRPWAVPVYRVKQREEAAQLGGARRVRDRSGVWRWSTRPGRAAAFDPDGRDGPRRFWPCNLECACLGALERHEPLSLVEGAALVMFKRPSLRFWVGRDDGVYSGERFGHQRNCAADGCSVLAVVAVFVGAGVARLTTEKLAPTLSTAFSSAACFFWNAVFLATASLSSRIAGGAAACCEAAYAGSIQPDRCPAWCGDNEHRRGRGEEEEQVGPDWRHGPCGGSGFPCI